jgi:UDP-glucose 4-epimerase
MNPSVVITGGNGFIGSHLTKRFLEKGWEVWVLTHRPDALHLAWQATGIEVSKLHIIRCDLLTETPLLTLPPQRFLIHTATANDVLSRQSCAGYELSVVGTRRLLEHFNGHPLEQVLLFSTLQVYGRELNGSYDESSPLSLENDYALNHYLAEELLRHWAGQRGCRGVVLRPSNVYGLPALPTVERWTLVPNCFCQELRDHQRLTLQSSGHQRRNFVSLETLFQACHHLLITAEAIPSTMNLFGAEQPSIREVAERCLLHYHALTQETANFQILSAKPGPGQDFTLDSQCPRLDPHHAPTLDETIQHLLTRLLTPP